MNGEHQPMPILPGADQHRPHGGLVGQVVDGFAFGRAQALDLLLGFGPVGRDLEVAPGHRRVGGDDLHRLVEPVAEPGDEVRVPGDHRVHRVAQPVAVDRTGEAEVQLDHVEVVVGAPRGGGVEQQPLLQRGQRQDVGDPVGPLELVDLRLVQPGRRDVRRGQSAAAVAHVRADAGQRLEPQRAQPGHLLAVERRGRPRPGCVQLGAVLGVHGAGVEVHGVHQRHGHRGAGGGGRRAVPADPPQLVGEFGGRPAQPAEVVEPDRRVGAVQVDLVVQVAQQPVGQRVGQGAQLLLGVFEQRAQDRRAGDDVRPGQAADVEGHRVFGGEPAHGAGQVHAGGQLLVAAVALDVDADRGARVVQEFRPGQGEPDQQDVVDPGVEGGRRLAEQRAGGLDVQQHR